MSRARLDNAMAAYLAAARELLAAWDDAGDDALNDGYPGDWPSFTEVVIGIESWCETHGVDVARDGLPTKGGALVPATVERLHAFCTDDYPGRIAVRFGFGKWDVTATRTFVRGYGDLKTGPMSGGLTCDAGITSEATSTTSSASLDQAINAALDGVALAIQKWQV